MTDLAKQTILVVDDMRENLDVMTGILLPEYRVKVATSAEIALKIINKSQPDLILLDVMMPDMDGYETCRILKSQKETAAIPVIFVTAMSELGDEQKGFEVGAVDYITKPVFQALVKARVKTHLTLANQQRATQEQVALRTRELEESQRNAIFMLGEAGHYNDNDTGVHIWRMADYATHLAKAAHWPLQQAGLLELAAPMHDTGKIGIPDEILKAPRRLTDEEMTTMKTHTQLGYDILSKSKTPLFQLAAEVALYHHEKWDGSGYPRGLSGEAIPASARIVAIADVFDALTMARPYKEPWPVEKAFNFIYEQSGSHFDSRLAELFLASKQEILALKDRWDLIEAKS